jgi:hypothetical protein
MYCPQCGSDASSGVQYCRSCGANLKVIGKAVALSEAIARSDRGPLPKIREMVKSLKVDHVTEEVSRALDKMNNEIARISPESKPIGQPWIRFGSKKTPAEKREQHISKGLVSLFSGAGLTIFLYYLSTALVLKLPPEVVAQIPFEIAPVVKVMWLIGLIPSLSGLGHIAAGLLIRPQRPEVPALEQPLNAPAEFPKPAAGVTSSMGTIPGSVTEGTTELLDDRPVQ